MIAKVLLLKADYAPSPTMDRRIQGPFQLVLRSQHDKIPVLPAHQYQSQDYQRYSMSKSEDVDQQQDSEVKHVAEEVFSSEKREDIWAIVIVLAIFLLSIAFPAQLHQFFSKTLYLF